MHSYVILTTLHHLDLVRKEKQVLNNTLLENTWMAETELNLTDIQGTVTSVELLRYQWSEAHKNKPKVKVMALGTSHQEGEKKKAENW